MQDALIETLRKSFTLAFRQINESNGKGYRIHLYAPWRDNGLGVSYYQVQLCGMNPLSGEDVKKEEIYKRFDFTTTSAQTGILTYHGRFRLCCTARLNDGRIIPFKEQEINLNYPQNCPYIRYTVSGGGGFKHVVLTSNCWANCKDKIWLRFDGHEQRLRLPVRADKTIRFYLPTSTDLEVKVRDDLIQVRKDMKL